MKTFCAILFLCAIAGILDTVRSADCESSFDKAMCHTYCIIYHLSWGKCIGEYAKKCDCKAKRFVRSEILEELERKGVAVFPKKPSKPRKGNKG